MLESGRVKDEGSVDPDENSIQIMADVDGMPKRWRALVYEFGAVIVLKFYNGGLDLSQARKELKIWREGRQRVWLQTDHIRPRERHS